MYSSAVAVVPSGKHNLDLLVDVVVILSKLNFILYYQHDRAYNKYIALGSFFEIIGTFSKDDGDAQSCRYN